MALRRPQVNIVIGPKTAYNLGIIGSMPKSKNIYFEIEVEKINENEKQIELSLIVKDNKAKENKREIIVSKTTMTKREATLVGWCYIFLYEKEDTRTTFDKDKGLKDEYKKKARHFLYEAIKNEDSFFDGDEPQSAIPYFLISKHNLYEEEGRVLPMLYRGSRCPDIFHNFYWELFRFEKDKIRKLDIAKKVLKQYPNEDNEYYIDFITNDLFDKGKTKEAKKFLNEQIAKIKKTDWQSGYSHLKITVLNVLLAEKDYIQAEKLLDRPIFNKSTDAFFRGKVYFEKGDYKKAIESFKETISYSTRDDDDTQVSYHYLLACYSKIKDLGEIKDIIENAKLCHQEFTVFYPIDYRYEDFVEKTLKELLKLKLDDLLKIRIRGLLAFVQTSNLPTPTGNDGEEKLLRALTKKEKILVGKIEKDIKEVIDYYPDDKLFNAVYSNILYLKKDFDNSFRHKLRGVEGISSSQTFFSLWVKMSDVSENFLTNYSDVVKDVIENYGVSVYDYIEHQFNEDIGSLYEKKRFTQIKKLYEYVKADINNLPSIGEYSYAGGGLFELGYALSESGDEKEARVVYEAYLEGHSKSSSVLNNLAIIYEKERELEKAKKFIKEAKDIAPDDEVVERNYNRIFASKEKPQEKQRQPSEKSIQKKTDPQISTKIENNNGFLMLNGGKIEIGPAKNVPFKLLQTLCPFGTPKAINAVFNGTNTERSKYKTEELTLPQKQDILRNRVKELQEILRAKKVKVQLVFNTNDETTFLQHLRG